MIQSTKPIPTNSAKKKKKTEPIPTLIVKISVTRWAAPMAKRSGPIFDILHEAISICTSFFLLMHAVFKII